MSLVGSQANNNLTEIEDEFDEGKFYTLLINKQHAELTQVLKNVATTLNTKPDNSELIHAINLQTQTINNFLSKQNSESVLAPTTNDIEVDNKILLSQKNIEKLEQEQLDILSKKKEWEFTIVRDNIGFIKSVIAKQIK